MVDKIVCFMVFDEVDLDCLLFILDGVVLVCDLINILVNDFGLEEFSVVVRDLFVVYGGVGFVIFGVDFLIEGYLMVYVVGWVSICLFCLVDFLWGDLVYLKVIFVGKGVVFDIGGLNLKLGGFMVFMKKDMGGVVNVFGFVVMIMVVELLVWLCVFVFCVENVVFGDVFWFGDVLLSCKGLIVEIGNIDVEGCLVFVDVLVLVDEENLDFLIDMVILIGVVWVVFGLDFLFFFIDDDELVEDIVVMVEVVVDFLWCLFFWKFYMKYFDSKVVDINYINISGIGFVGLIIVVLFLLWFVENVISWVYFDIYGWNLGDKFGKLVGGEV